MPEPGQPDAVAAEVMAEAAPESDADRQVRESVAVSRRANRHLNPEHCTDRETRVAISEELINAIQKRPAIAETMLWPIVESTILEEDEEIAEHSSKALRLLYRESPEIVREALEQVAAKTPPGFQIRTVPAILERLDGEPQPEADRRVKELFHLGTLDMRKWARTEFVVELVQAKQRDGNFRNFQKQDPPAAALVLERVMDEANALYEWMNRYQGVVPAT